MSKQHIEADNAWSAVFNARLGGGPANLSDVDAELEVVRVHYAKARQRRNELVGACRLPAEVLYRIFGMVQADWKPQRHELAGDTTSISSVQYSSGWMSLTHICSKWRKIALNDSILWREIDCLVVHPIAIPTIMSRCKRAPIRLSFESIDPSDEYIVECLKSWSKSPFLERVEALSVTGGDIKAFNSLPLTLPHLKKLALRFDGSPTSVPYWDLDMSLRYYCVELEQLSIVGSVMPWRRLFTGTLTHLEVLLHPVEDLSLHIPVGEFNYFLTLAHNLKSLYLHNALNPASSKTPKHSKPALLSFLALSFAGDYAPVALFEYYTIPATTAVSVPLYNLKATTNASVSEIIADVRKVIANVGKVVAAVFQGSFGDKDELRELVLGPTSAYVRPWTPNGPVLTEIESFETTLQPDCHEPRSRYIHLQANPMTTPLREGMFRFDPPPLDDICQHLPNFSLSSITTLTLCSKISVLLRYPPAWQACFSAAQRVRNVRLPINEFVVPLCTALEAKSKSQPAFTLFPGLESITLGAVDKELQTDHAAQSLMALSVMSMLLKREDGGAAIREIRISKEAEGWAGDPWVGVRELVQFSARD